MTLTFPPRPSPPRPRKRGRAVTDIDGEHSCLHKKKRRLRLFLITSRLSPQFSHPATNIVDRGNSKIAVWAKQKNLGRNLLRKAAILNRIRRRTISVKEKEEGMARIFNGGQEQKQLEMARLTLEYGGHDTFTRPLLKVSDLPPADAVETEDAFETSVVPPSTTSSSSTSSPILSDDHEDDTSQYRSPNDAYSYLPTKAQIPRKSYLPLPPSPLGLSNYDAFDLEDDIHDPYAHLDDEDEEMDSSSSPSAFTSASLNSTLSTAGTDISETKKTPPQMTWCDFNIMDYEEPVMGDYDQIDQGGDAIWPDVTQDEPSLQPLLPTSSSPNFSALLPISTENVVPLSPNFSAALPEERRQTQWTSQQPSHGGVVTKENATDLEQERSRQRKFMFLRFNS